MKRQKSHNNINNITQL